MSARCHPIRFHGSCHGSWEKRTPCTIGSVYRMSVGNANATRHSYCPAGQDQYAFQRWTGEAHCGATMANGKPATGAENGCVCKRTDAENRVCLRLQRRLPRALSAHGQGSRPEHGGARDPRHEQAGGRRRGAAGLSRIRCVWAGGASTRSASPARRWRCAGRCRDRPRSLSWFRQTRVGQEGLPAIGRLWYNYRMSVLSFHGWKGCPTAFRRPV